MKKLVLTLTLLTSLSAFGDTEGTRGGGDDVGIEFQNYVRLSLNELRVTQPAIFAKADLQLRGRPKFAIFVVDSALPIATPLGIQDSAAINDPATMQISINRARWNAVESSAVKQAIALHEVLSLAGLEKTGHYEISGKFLTKAAATSKTFDDARFSYLSAHSAFDNARVPQDSDLDQTKWTYIGVASAPEGAEVNGQSWYQPDGLITGDGESRKVFASFGKQTDTFGTTAWDFALTWENVGSSLSHEILRTPGKITPFGLQTTTSGTREKCAGYLTCKITQNALLLCARKTSDQRPECSYLPHSHPTKLMLFRP